MNQNHLSTAEVLTYRENIGSAGSIRIGRHLLACKECRSILPEITGEEFRVCVSGTAPISAEDRKAKRLFDFTHLTRLWTVSRIAAFAGLSIALLAGVYFVSVLRSNISDDTLAKNADNSIDRRMDPIDEGAILAPTSSGKQTSESDSTYSESNPKPKLHVSRSEPSKNKKAGDTLGKVPVGKNAAVSTTRGLASGCSSSGQFEMEFGSIEQTYVLKWKKFPNAVKYHLYISDDDEILIDEFETEQATSYTLTKPLTQKKSYRWKVIITLANGKTMNVAAQNFSSHDFLSVQNGAIHKTRALTRCSTTQ